MKSFISESAIEKLRQENSDCAIVTDPSIEILPKVTSMTIKHIGEMALCVESIPIDAI